MIPETVLIETLWNVNQADEWLFSRKSEVLIETLWNVNFDVLLRSELLVQKF